MSHTPDQLNQYKEMFELFDKEGKGSLTHKEVCHVIRAAGMNPSQGQLQV